MFTDLHLHTHYSDGTLSPTEVVQKAKLHGIGLISVCDHNSVGAYPELKKACDENGIKLITGVEIDCFMGDRYVHLLGYGFELENAELLELINDCSKKMQYLNDSTIINMAANGYPIDLDEYAAWVSPPEIGGYKNSNFLLHKGIIKEIPEYFPLYRKYGVKLSDIGLPKLEDACKMIKAAGGVPVLAHPFHILGKEDFTGELVSAVNAGVMGIECFYPDQNEEVTEMLTDFCDERNLITTAGSDDHGEFLKCVNGIVFQLGEIMMDISRLNIDKLSPL